MRRGARLAEAVTLLDAELEARPDGVGQLPAAGRSAAVEPLERLEVVLVDQGALAQGEDDRGRDVGDGDAVALDEGACLFEVPPGHDDALCARQEGDIEDDGEAVDVEEGEDAELDVGIPGQAPRVEAVGLDRVGDDVGVVEHNALGKTGCAL